MDLALLGEGQKRVVAGSSAGGVAVGWVLGGVERGVGDRDRRRRR